LGMVPQKKRKFPQDMKIVLSTWHLCDASCNDYRQCVVMLLWNAALRG
jgi:hypothetical protein